MPFDPADRPRAPQHPDPVITPVGRVAQRTLRGIHDHLRAERVQVVRAVRAAANGAGSLSDARAVVAPSRWRRPVLSRCRRCRTPSSG